MDGHTLATVPSLGRPVGKVFQVYAPAQNEMGYTNDWHGPFYGFRRVVDGWRFTDGARRLKPISLYYHFYSGAKPAALSAMKEAYQWALAQEVRPLYVSAYAHKVADYQNATILRRADGSFQVDGVANVRTLRLPRELGWPALDASTGVVGVRDLPQGRYVALDGSPSVTLALAPHAPRGPYLLSSNAGVVSWRRTAGEGAATTVTARLRVDAGKVRVTFGGCATGVTLQGGPANVSRNEGPDGRTELLFPAGETGEVTIVCRET
jgi:polysaccharide biosynthesis protein PelA